MEYIHIAHIDILNILSFRTHLRCAYSTTIPLNLMNRITCCHLWDFCSFQAQTSCPVASLPELAMPVWLDNDEKDPNDPNDLACLPRLDSLCI